jgi:hypothetical protein
MWHIPKKVPEKVGPELNEDDEFHASLSKCVWSSGTPGEFGERWPRIMWYIMAWNTMSGL